METTLLHWFVSVSVPVSVSVYVYVYVSVSVSVSECIYRYGSITAVAGVTSSLLGGHITQRLLATSPAAAAWVAGVGSIGAHKTNTHTHTHTHIHTYTHAHTHTHAAILLMKSTN